jgi:Rps23 Pro-64 3,4-dihydroxylase Tpa1-like proline 4-hydroxylase
MSKRDRQGATVGKSDAFVNTTHFQSQNVATYKHMFLNAPPYPHLMLRDVFDESLLHKVKEELLAGNFFQKRNDLYDFHQSDDLKKMKAGATTQLRDIVYGTAFRKLMADIVGFELNETIDISAAKYVKGSYLLCHDDDLSERRIAYIIYLVPESWTEADGGTLDLFGLADPDSLAKDPSAAVVPGGVRTRLVPEWNSMAFFAVSEAIHPLIYANDAATVFELDTCVMRAAGGC